MSFYELLEGSNNEDEFRKLSVTDKTITIPGQLNEVSVKNLFTMLIKKQAWNSDAQQGSSGGNVFVLNCLIEMGWTDYLILVNLQLILAKPWKMFWLFL